MLQVGMILVITGATMYDFLTNGRFRVFLKGPSI